jgi:multidrug efflux pump subunit AcrA (membrane-fusion protein)
VHSSRLPLLLAAAAAFAAAACAVESNGPPQDPPSPSASSSSGDSPASSSSSSGAPGSSGSCGGTAGTDPVQDGAYTNVDATGSTPAGVERTLTVDRAAGTVTVRFVRDGKQVEERWRVRAK